MHKKMCWVSLTDPNMRRWLSWVHSNRINEMHHNGIDVSGARVIPMTDDVYECFHRIIENRKRPKVEPLIGGKSGFLFLDKNGLPMVALHWEKYFQHICQKYNKIYKAQMPKVTPHVCRHTFCSNMAKSGMNPKTLQYLMGHSDIGVTLNTYAHVNVDDAQREMQRVVNGE